MSEIFMEQYWHGIGPVREIGRAMEMKEAS
jgi:hypothetical protein